MLKHAAILAVALAVSPWGAAQHAADIAEVEAGRSCAGCNLFQAGLAYTDATGLDLSNSRLRQSDLSLATYDDVSFAGADLSVANLFGARFNGCDFGNANLADAIAVGTYFGSSSLSNANIDGANMSGADLSRVKGLSQMQLDKACGDSSTKLPTGLAIRACR